MTASADLDKDGLIEDLRSVWASIGELGAGLTETDWGRDTRCPGWTVRDVVSHMIGTELMLSGAGDPSTDLPDAAHVRNDVGRFNEVSVERRRGRPGHEILEEFLSVTSARLAALEAMDEADFAEETWTPAGQDSYGRFMRIRVFDCWMHELDMRAAVGRPGGMEPRVVHRSLDEMSTALGYAVGKKAGVAEGTSVAFVVTGPIERRFDVVVEGRAHLADSAVPDPTVTIACGVGEFAALCGGRVDPHGLLASGSVTIEGDRDIGEQVVTTMAFVI